MRKLLTLVAILTIAPFVLAQNLHCRQVGGSISTNFLNPSTTFGSATGDLKGGIGVNVLNISSGSNGATVFHNQHDWVTESGDTLYLRDADATAYPAAGALVAINYVKGVDVIGGTGRFADATGHLDVWGAADLQHKQIVLRYKGEICGD